MTDLFRVPSLWLAGELAVFQIDHLSCRVYPLTRADLAGSIPDRFNEIAAHDPQKMAVCDHVKSLTYLELHRLVNKAAAIIRRTADPSATPMGSVL